MRKGSRAEIGAVGRGLPPSGRPIISTVVLYAIQVSITTETAKRNARRCSYRPRGLCAERLTGSGALSAGALSPEETIEREGSSSGAWVAGAIGSGGRNRAGTNLRRNLSS